MESLEREDSTQYCKVISLQLKFINLKKKKKGKMPSEGKF